MYAYLCVQKNNVTESTDSEAVDGDDGRGGMINWYVADEARHFFRSLPVPDNRP